MNDTLLPCPHCGGKGQFELDEYWDSSRVICDSCSAETGEAEGMAAISRWNRRTEQPALRVPMPEDVLEEIESALADEAGRLENERDGWKEGSDSYKRYTHRIKRIEHALDWLQRLRPTQEEGTHE